MTDSLPYTLLAAAYDSRADLAAKRALASLIRDFADGSGGVVLDLACGTGNIARALLDLGYDVHGIDRSPEMLAIARSKLQGRRFTAKMQGMEQLCLPTGAYRAAVCGSFSLGYLTSDDAFQSVLQEVSRSLAPGGAFVFDMASPNFFTPNRLAAQRGAWARSGITMNFRLTGDGCYEYIYSLPLSDGRAAVERHAGRCRTNSEVRQRVEGALGGDTRVECLESGLPDELARTGLTYYVLRVP